MNKKVTLVEKWLYSATILILLMITIGGITRLTESGLSIVDWRPITGIIPPLDNQQWEFEFNKYQLYPEFQKVNSSITLSDFKKIYFWEYLHRMIGRILGLYFIFPFIFFIYTKKITYNHISKLSLIFILGGFQAFIGWYMVKSGLVDIPDVSHYRLALHLLLAFTSVL